MSPTRRPVRCHPESFRILIADTTGDPRPGQRCQQIDATSTRSRPWPFAIDLGHQRQMRSIHGLCLDTSATALSAALKSAPPEGAYCTIETAVVTRDDLPDEFAAMCSKRGGTLHQRAR